MCVCVCVCVRVRAQGALFCVENPQLGLRNTIFRHINVKMRPGGSRRPSKGRHTKLTHAYNSCTTYLGWGSLQLSAGGLHV